MVLRVRRFNPLSPDSESVREYFFPTSLAEKHTVFSLIQYVYDNIDHTLAFRGTCGRGVCGSCTMKINGRPGLTCMRRADSDITVEPLPKLRVIRDLVVDMRSSAKSK